jgi:hypothetical protein
VGKNLTYALITIFILLIPLYPVTVHCADDLRTGCIKCHYGIESIGDKHDWITCEECHRGNSEAADKEKSHIGLFKNPGDFEIIDDTCGMCHCTLQAQG